MTDVSFPTAQKPWNRDRTQPGAAHQHRLDRQGNNQLNWAIYVFYFLRGRHDPKTRTNIERRRSEGKTTPEDPFLPKRLIA
jgi:transposase